MRWYSSAPGAGVPPGAARGRFGVGTAAFVLASLLASVSVLACGGRQQRGGEPALDGERRGPSHCEQAGRSYVARDANACRVTLFSCAQGTPFFDEACGCGCEGEREALVAAGAP